MNTKKRKNISDPVQVTQNFIRKRGLDMFLKLLELKQQHRTLDEIAYYIGVSQPRALRIINTVIQVEYKFKPQVLDIINHGINCLQDDVTKTKQKLSAFNYHGELADNGKLISAYKKTGTCNILPFSFKEKGLGDEVGRICQ